MRPLFTDGFEEAAKVLGISDDMTQKMVNDFEAKLSLTELGNGHVRAVNTSKISPYDVIFEFNKEFDLNWMGETFKVAFSKSKM